MFVLVVSPGFSLVQTMMTTTTKDTVTNPVVEASLRDGPIKQFDVVKHMYLSPQKMVVLFSKVFCDFDLVLEIFSTHFSIHSPECISHMNNRMDKLAL